MQVVSLKIKNFLSIADAEITPGKVNQIVGGNNNGKTSVLRALQFAAIGSSDPSLVRKGEKEGEVIVELDDGTFIQRKLSDTGKQNLTVKRGEMKASSPQALLDVIFERNSFNPIDILLSKNRTEIIMNAIPMNITLKEIADQLGTSAAILPPVDEKQHGLKVIEQLHTYYYQRRTEANRTASDKLKKFEFAESELPKDVKVPEKTKQELEAAGNEANAAIGALKEKQQQAVNAANMKATIEQKANNLRETIMQDEQSVALINSRIAHNKKIIEEYETSIEQLRQEAMQAPDYSEEIRAHEQRVADLRVLYGEISTYEQIEKRRQVVEEMKKEAEEASLNAKIIDDYVQKLKTEIPLNLMGKVAMPITGLGYTQEGGFTLDGFPIDKLSTSQSTKLAVAIAKTLAAKSKIICIDGAEHLDEESYKAFREEIQNDGYVYLITKVGEPFSAGQGMGDKIIEMNKGMVQQ